MVSKFKRFRRIGRTLWVVSRGFLRVLRPGPEGVAERLLQLQRAVDRLRDSVWQARREYDPRLTTPHFPAPDDSQSLTERVLHLVDSRRKDDAA